MTSLQTTRPSPDRWDRFVLLLVPFGAVMLACVSTSVHALEDAQSDVILYFQDAALFAARQLPYAGFHFEYPPLALVPMALPYLAWLPGSPTILDYEWLFAFQNALLASLVAWLVAWLAMRPGSGAWSWRALALWALLAVVEAPVLAWRFDIAAVALALGGVVLVLAGRPTLGGVALALGSLVKIFPGALLPVLLAWLLVQGERSRAVRLLAGFAVAAAAVMAAVVLAVGIDPVRQFLSYQADRLVQIESVMSSALLLLHVLTGESVSVDYGYQSVQIVGSGTAQFLSIENLLLVVGIGGVAVLAWLRFRSERRATGQVEVATLIAYLSAAILAVLVTNKVFSAQYLLWLLPLGCLLPRRQAAVLVAISILSIVVFPLSYAQLYRLEVPAILTLVVRNALLLGLLGWALVRFRPLREPARRPAVETGAGVLAMAEAEAGAGPMAEPEVGGRTGRAIEPGA